MADGDDFGALIGAILGLMLMVLVIIAAVIALMSAGVVFGAGISLKNYYLAFRHNVQLERATP